MRHVSRITHALVLAQLVGWEFVAVRYGVRYTEGWQPVLLPAAMLVLTLGSLFGMLPKLWAARKVESFTVEVPKGMAKPLVAAYIASLPASVREEER